jgi:hypothetical protein
MCRFVNSLNTGNHKLGAGGMVADPILRIEGIGGGRGSDFREEDSRGGEEVRLY